MMIRINLLPVRQVQKREAGRQYIVLMVGMFIMTAAANGYWYKWIDDKREAAQRRLDDTNSRIAQLEKVIGEVTNLQKRKSEVEEKLKVLEKLTKQRAGPVKMLDALATAIPKKCAPALRCAVFVYRVSSGFSHARAGRGIVARTWRAAPFSRRRKKLGRVVADLGGRATSPLPEARRGATFF